MTDQREVNFKLLSDRELNELTKKYTNLLAV